MRLIESSLAKALPLSLLLHGLLFVGIGIVVAPQTKPQAVAQIYATLVKPKLALAEEKPVSLPVEEKKPAKSARKTPAPAAAATPPDTGAKPMSSMLAGPAARSASQQLAKELFYPPEAIAAGLEGEAIVQLFLDDAGNVIAARLEATSGHTLLDDAALRAARSLRALPASAPREALLPVRFRLVLADGSRRTAN